MSVPAARLSVAAPCRRSWDRIGGRPAANVNRSKCSPTQSGVNSLPSTAVKIRPLSIHADPQPTARLPASHRPRAQLRQLGGVASDHVLPLRRGQHRAKRRPDPLFGHRPGGPPAPYRRPHLGVIGRTGGEQLLVLTVDLGEDLLDHRHEQPVHAHAGQDIANMCLPMGDVADQRGTPAGPAGISSAWSAPSVPRHRRPRPKR